jgi:hypothetical protein
MKDEKIKGNLKGKIIFVVNRFFIKLEFYICYSCYDIMRNIYLLLPI